MPVRRSREPEAAGRTARAHWAPGRKRRSRRIDNSRRGRVWRPPGGGPRAVKPPDLAVIIPARNEAPRIGRCLGSIHRALEYAGATAAEVIVVDDDSTDDTSQIARAHGAVAVRQSPRGGPLAAWAFGVANSSARLLFFV